ncbi:MAG: hypothetical protein OXT73_07935 [Bacteroidota bacterium]|nr:hypothetical protein [Bacteroidota bacterium]
MRAFLLSAFVATLFISTPLSAQQLDMDLFDAMQPRSIGPAGMSGRVTAIDAVHVEPNVIYVGTASGGLWKSTSGGVDWTPIFDEEPAHSIGAVAIYQKTPDLVWVGAGEGNPRNSQSAGNGVYKSIDGGATWAHLGLEDSRNIHRIILHPDNPDVALIGVQGPAWGETDQRGVFRTNNGGKTFEKVLYVNERTGIGDMVADPSNPNHILAAMWEFRRWPWFFKSGGEGSGLYETWDGGQTWEEIGSDRGLPEGELGRMGLAFAHNEPEVVYALVEAKKNALYRSDDGGATWRMINDDDGVNGRPFYYADIYTDPENENRLYKIETYIYMSEDGGRSFRQWQPGYSANGVHPDHHAFWVSAEDPDFIIEGNDGGMAITHDKGRTWRFVENLPVAQFYHINVDNEFPYNVMGGMQDNGSWVGPAYVFKAGGIRNHLWQEVAFGDGFDVIPDPEDSRFGYAMSQGGSLSRFDKETGNSSFIQPLHPDPDVFLRYNWNAAFEQDPHDPNTIYYGSQFVHRSINKGQSWEVISPDLTTNDPEKQQQEISGGLTYDITQAENHTTITAIAASPLETGILWAGSDDGNVQLSRDGGGSWTEVGSRIRDLPETNWVAQIKASRYNAAEAVVVFDDHRRNNWEPYVYRTQDWGRSWQRMVNSNDVFGFALSFVQDPVEPRLMFIGTEFGLYVSIDEGDTWTKWTAGYPTASTIDLAIQEREADLVIGTFGRSAWVLDDIRPLRELASRGAELLDEPVHAYPAPTAYLASTIQAAGTRFKADAIYAGENRPGGARITYSVNPDAYMAAGANDEAREDGEVEQLDSAEEYMNASDMNDDEGSTSKASDEVTIRILDGDEVIRTFSGPAVKGMNRSVWTLRRKGVRGPSRTAPRKNASEPSGPQVLPGTYGVEVIYGADTTRTSVAVEFDPRTDADLTVLQARHAMYRDYEEMVETAATMMDRVREAKEIVARVNSSLGDRVDLVAKELKERGKALTDSLNAFQDAYFGPQGKQGIYRPFNTISGKVSGAGRYLFSSDRAPNTPEDWSMSAGRRALDGMLAQVNAFLENPWAEYVADVRASDAFRVDDLELVEMH